MNYTTFDITRIIRPHLLTLKPYSTARDEFQGVADIFLDANENPYPSAYHRYPDPHQRKLKEKISRLKNVSPENIFIGNGSDEVIDLIIRLTCEPKQHSLLITNPTYGMYEVSAQINGIKTIRVPLTDTFEVDPEKVLSYVNPSVKVIFLCSPNNPSGNLLNKEAVRKVIDSFTGLVVVDEAYIDFSGDGGFLPELNKWPNLVVMQTLSKAYALAGLRIGLAMGNADVIAWLNKIKPPYNVSSAAQEYAMKQLDDQSTFRKQVEEIIAERNSMVTKLSGIKTVLYVYPSDANFLLVRFTNARAVYRHLLSNGIIVRDRSTVLHGDNCLRITIGTPAENKKLIETLNKFEPTGS
ncbi:MAG: histidinol-phosphate transaminase [Cyclobacteriaceae bacterium]|nr:histidinol-phosphate transaminase [Cyclobacteriaceae bacterium]